MVSICEDCCRTITKQTVIDLCNSSQEQSPLQNKQHTSVLTPDKFISEEDGVVKPFYEGQKLEDTNNKICEDKI